MHALCDCDKSDDSEANCSPATFTTVPMSSEILTQVSPESATYTSLQKVMVLPVHTALPGCSPVMPHKTNGFRAVNSSIVIPAKALQRGHVALIRKGPDVRLLVGGMV